MSSLSRVGGLVAVWKSLPFTFTVFTFLMKVKATDADEGINGRVWYRIVKGKSRCPFVHRWVCTRLRPGTRTASGGCPLRPFALCSPQKHFPYP